jgi:peptidoglycan/LPS O-acetylase OafA/YrhL
MMPMRPQQPLPDATGPVHAVDLLRFAAALFVVAYHYGTSFARAPSAHADAVLHGLASPVDLSQWTWSGWIGVEVFFMISGYVIAMSARGVGSGIFLRRRLLRLLPATWICATITLVALMWGGGDAPAALMTQWLGAVAYSPFGDMIDASYWTLGIELGFYLMVAVVIRRGGTAQALDRLALVIGGISALFWFAVIGGWAGGVSRLLQILLLQHGCFFALGMMIRAMHARGFAVARIVMFLVLASACSIETVLHARFMAGQLALSVSATVPLTLFLGSFALLMAAQRLQAGFGALRFASAFRTLGFMTFPLYLLHQVAGAVLLSTLMRSGIGAMPATIVTASAALGLSWLIAVHAEPWLRAHLQRALGAISPARAPAPDTPPIAFRSTG